MRGDTGGAAASILNAIFDGVDDILSWLGDFISALFGTATQGDAVAGALSGLLPLVAIPVACAVIFLAIKVVKKISWGY